MAINLDHVTEQITVTDTATNASLTVQPKGTGAFNIAAGSSGVNISNGGTVTAITLTNNGGGSGGYTGFPTITISPPTTAGGVQATATVLVMQPITASVQSGGTGYTLNDVVSWVGGTPQTVAATFRVTGVSGGVVTAVVAVNFAPYSVLPTAPVSTTGGTGTGLTLTGLTYAVGGTFTITNAGSGYVEQPTVTFSGGGGSGAAAYATVGSATVIRGLGPAMDFYTPAGTGFRVGDAGATSTYYWQAIGGAFNGILRGGGSTQNALIQTGGTGGISLQTNNGAQTQAIVSHTASAVNYVQVTGAATTLPPTISAQGSDSSVGMGFATKSANYLYFLQSGANPSFRITTGATSNYLDVKGGATGVAPIISAQGSDTNVPLVLQPQGTGALQAQQTDSTATGGNARGQNAVDWQTARGAAGQVASGISSVVSGGARNQSSGDYSTTGGGYNNINQAYMGVISGGQNNTNQGTYSYIGGGQSNSAQGLYTVIGGGWTNSGTAQSAVTTQSATMNGTTSVTLSASNASIKVGQYISGTFINGQTYVAAISGTTLTLSQVAGGSGTSTLSFFTPHGVVVGGGNNQATGSYSFIGGGGDAGTAANRNVASGDWSFVGGGAKNVASAAGSVVVGGGTDGSTVITGNFASGISSAVLGGLNNSATGQNSSVLGGSNSSATSGNSLAGGNATQATGGDSAALGGRQNIANSTRSIVLGGNRGTTRSITGATVFSSADRPIADTSGISQAMLLILARQTVDATPALLTSDTGTAASTTNQVILPNNSAYYFKGTVIANVTGGGNTKGWTIEGAIKRGANAASTALVGTPTVVSAYADTGAATWAITATADTTNGGLAITFTGQAATTIRVVAKLETTEVTF